MELPHTHAHACCPLLSSHRQPVSCSDTHSFKKMEFQPAEAKKFFSTVRKEMALLATSLPEGIMVKTFEDRMVGVPALVGGAVRTQRCV